MARRILHRIPWTVALAASLGLIALSTGCPTNTPSPKSETAPALPRADLVMLSGSVVTWSEATSGATAIAVKDGRIVALGSDDEVKRWVGPETQVVGLRGATVLPGLVDGHMHVAGLGRRRFAVDLVGTGSVDEVKARVEAAVKRAKPGEWIRGRGWDQNDWSTRPGHRPQFPTAKDLDGISPVNPVILTRIDGHAIWANSKAMELANVSGKTRSRSGGQIIKRRGRPTGVFIDNSMAIIQDLVPPLGHDELERAILLAQQECLAAGLTQVHDMGASLDELDVLQALDARGALKLRVYAYHDGMAEDLTPVVQRGPQIPSDPSTRRLTVRGVKFLMDGALGSRGAALLDPYSDDRKNSGTLLMDPALFAARVKTVSDAGFQVATHAIGDKTNRVVLDAYEELFGKRASALRPRIEHAQVVTLDDLPRFGRIGVIASVQPTHATSDMPWAEQRVGAKRIEGAYAWQSLLTTNATIAAGSDAPVEDISPVAGLYAAITRKDIFGGPEGGWTPKQRMTPREAVYAFTAGAAWASFRESEAGEVAVGRVADLTVLDKNPITATEDQLASMQPQLTVIEGKIAFARPGADEPPEPPPPPPVKTATVATSTAAR